MSDEIGEGPKLRGLRDVQREMVRVYRQMKSNAVPIAEGTRLVGALDCLAAVMQDQRDSVWTKRAKVLWDEREAKHAEPKEH